MVTSAQAGNVQGVLNNGLQGAGQIAGGGELGANIQNVGG